MEQICIGKKENGGDPDYGYLIIRNKAQIPLEANYVGDIDHLTYFVAGVIAGQLNPHVHWVNGLEGDMLRSLSRSEIEEIVSEPHIGDKIREAFIRDGLTNP